MSDIEAPLRYSEPVVERPARGGKIGLLLAVSLGVAIAAVGLAMLSREAAEPLVLAFLAGLAVVGIFTLFAGAAGIVHLGEKVVGSNLPNALLETMPSGVLVTDLDGAIVYANQAYQDLTGEETGEEPGADIKTVERVFAAQPAVAEHMFRLARAARALRDHEEEFQVLPRGPENDAAPAQGRWFRVSVRPLPAGADVRTPRGALVWTLTDITPEKERQQLAFQDLQTAVDYLDNAPAGFFAASADGRIQCLNATLANWLGYDLAETAAGELSLSQILSGDGEALLDKAAHTPGLRVQHIDIDLIRKDGTSLPVRLLHRVMPGGSGEDAQCRTLVLNRTPGAETDDAARAAEVRFARFFQSAPIAIAAVNGEGRIGSTNAAFARMFQRPSSDSEGMRALELVDEAGRDEMQAALNAAKAGQVAIDPIEVTFEAGGERSGRVYVSPVIAADESDDAAIVFAIDTTQQRALEVQFAQAQKLNAIGQLAGGIAHDLNNVLTAIIGFSDLLLGTQRTTDPAFQNVINIKQNANRAAALVRQLLAFSRKQTMRPKVLRLQDVLSDLSVLLMRLLGEKIELNVANDRDLWLIRADLNQFEQVVINLAVNARDAMPDGGKLDIRTANISERDSKALGETLMTPGEYVLIEVSDSGTGMPESVLEKIFEPFFTTKGRDRGTGLGLSTVYGIVKQTGGYIYPESEPGAGTTFRIFLPRYVPTEEEIRESTPAAEAPKAPRDLTGSETVLLVEDEEAVRTFATRALSSRGYTVLSAGTGVEALELMDEHDNKVDLVVSDVVMPEMDGPTLLKELRKRRPELKIIFMSGYAEDAFEKNLDQSEQFVFLPKPFSLPELTATVKETLQG